MNVGDTFDIYLGYHYGGKLLDKNLNLYKFKILNIYKKELPEKDLFLCEEVDYGYRECFQRMDLEEIANED